MKTEIHETDDGWFAHNGNATTQYFATREELEAALETEKQLIAEQGLCDLAVPEDSPLVWD